MTEMTKQERLRSALMGDPVDHPPVSMWGHDFLREWRPRDLVAATLDRYRKYDWDFIKLNPRATHFAEAWGNVYEQPTQQHQPQLLSHVVSDELDLETVEPVDPVTGVFGDHLYALRLLRDEVGDDVDILHTVFSPLSVTAQLCGSDARLQELAGESPAAVHRAIAAVGETLAGYAEAAFDAGATGIFFAPLRWASRDTASEDFYREFGRPYDLVLLDAMVDAQVTVLHVCRNNNMLRLLLDYPVDAFNWADHGEGNPTLREVKGWTAAAVMGGIDHTSLRSMSPDEVRTQVRDAMASGTERLVVTGGCAIPPDTPDANLEAAVETVRGG